jgi:hypothetical protein
MARQPSRTMNTVCNPTGLPASRIESSHHSVSNHLLSSPKTWVGFRLRGLPLRSIFTSIAPTGQGSAQRHLGFAFDRQARHDNRPNRVRLYFLRTDRSPPVALQPASRRRSFIRIQAPTRNLTRTCTSLIQRAGKRTCRRIRG